METHRDLPSKRQYLDAQSRRDSILKAADEVLARDGLARLTIVEVAHRAGISRQLVYQHFGDLNALLVEVIQVRMAHMRLSFESSDGSRVLEVREVVERQLRRVLHLSARDRQLMRSMFGDISALPRDLWPTVAQLRHSIVARWAELIDPQVEVHPLSYAKMGIIINAIIGTWDLILDGTLGEDEAVTLLMKVVESLFVLPW